MKALLLLLVALFPALTACFVNAGSTTSAVPAAAQQAYAAHKSELHNPRYLTVIDYSKPLFTDRLAVYDMQTGAVVLRCPVSHALKSGIFFASTFSNAPGTNLTSRGTFITQETYTGKYGYSLRVKGVSGALNSNARARAIVFHPSKGMTHSNGCFMTDAETNQRLINLIKDGSLVYVAN